MTEHHLKTEPAYFEAMLAGHKPFTIRKNDRDFQVGDTVIKEEVRGNTCFPPPTGRQAGPFTIAYMSNFGCREGFVILGLEGAHSPLTPAVNTEGPETTDHTLQETRAHVTAYYASAGVVDFIRRTGWSEETRGRANSMLMAAMKAMNLALQSLEWTKQGMDQRDWWTLCCQITPLLSLDNSALASVELASGIRATAKASGFPGVFAEGFITDMAKRLR